MVAPGVIPSGQTAREGLSSAARVETHPETWRSDGFGGGTMTVTVTEPARPSVTYLVVLVHQEDGWKIAATYPVDTTSTPRP